MGVFWRYFFVIWLECQRNFLIKNLRFKIFLNLKIDCVQQMVGDKESVEFKNETKLITEEYVIA